MKYSLLLALIFVAFIGEAQIGRISLKAGANYSMVQSADVSERVIPLLPWYMGTNGYTPPSSATIRHTFDNKMGFEFGGTFDYRINNRLFITSGISVSITSFKKNSSLAPQDFYTGSGFLNYYVPGGSYYGANPPEFSSPDGQSNPFLMIYQREQTGKTNIIYIQVPVLIGTSLFNNKLLVRGGGTFSVSPYSSEYKIRQDMTDYKETNPDNINKILGSLTISSTYLISKIIGIDFTANRSFTSIYKSNNINYTLISFGVSCSLSK